MNINQILKNEPGCSRYGAQMGRRDQRGDPDRAYKFHLQRLRLYDGAYDAGGAYFGGPATVYCAFVDDEEDGHVRMFLRAPSRKAAKFAVNEEYPNARFYR